MEQSNHFKAGMINTYSARVLLGAGSAQQSGMFPRIERLPSFQGCILFTNIEDTVLQTWVGAGGSRAVKRESDRPGPIAAGLCHRPD
jgi:hypothetical protein